MLNLFGEECKPCPRCGAATAIGNGERFCTNSGMTEDHSDGCSWSEPYYDSALDTSRHIDQVRKFINEVVGELEIRGLEHDESKLSHPEKKIFDEYTPKLAGITYGSDEYKAMMKEMKPAIEHHNAVNRHHPEHFKLGITGMNLIDLMEMICDWKAATMRHNDGDIARSLKINAERFGMNDQLRNILENTIEYMEWRPLKTEV